MVKFVLAIYLGAAAIAGLMSLAVSHGVRGVLLLVAALSLALFFATREYARRYGS